MNKLKQQFLCTCVLSVSSLLSQNTYATAFLPQDPRALGMGGVGVAAANSAQAHFYNPSLLHNARADEDFNFEIMGAIRAADNDHLIQAMKDFDDEQLFINFSDDLASFTTALARQVIDLNEVLSTRDDFSNSSVALRQGIHDVTGKSITVDANVGTLLSIPNGQKISWTAYINGWSSFSVQGTLAPNDDQTMEDIINLLDFDINSFDPTVISNALDILDPENKLQSTLSMNGALFIEYGLSLASKYVTGGYDIDVGITPKYIQVVTYDYVRSLEELDQNSEPYEQEEEKTYSTFNFDLGISKQLTENWKSGIVIKNIIPQSFKSPSGRSKARLEPAARVGVSYANNWINLGADLDLTENADVISFSKSRFLAMGAEVDVWLLKLRAGYRANLSAKGGNVPSIGAGLYLFGLNVDAAIAANQLDIPSDIDELLEYDDLSASVQVGLQF